MYYHMISKTLKLTSRDIHYMSQKAHKKRSALGTVMIIRQYPNRCYHQLGIAISSKIHKSSVKRNLIKRILYTMLYRYVDSLLSGHQIYIKCFFVVSQQDLKLRELLHTRLISTAQIQDYISTSISQDHFTHSFRACIRYLDKSNFG